MVYPPSATNAAPWTNDDFGEQRKRMQSAISVGVPALWYQCQHDEEKNSQMYSRLWSIFLCYLSEKQSVFARKEISTDARLGGV